MTLFISCLLIYNFNMSGWWYGVAAVIWICQLIAITHGFVEQVEKPRGEQTDRLIQIQDLIHRLR